MSTDFNALDPDLVSDRRRSEWREKVAREAAVISEEVSSGLFLHFENKSEVKTATAALKLLSPTKRRKLWKVVFPGIAEVVELAWNHLSGQTIAHRDGGSAGTGSRFKWKVSDERADHFKFEWLRKLLIVVGPFPEMDLGEVVGNIGLIAHGRTEESCLPYRETSGHMYDSDAAAYAACALLENDPDNPLANRVAEILEQQLLGKIPNGIQRATFTAFLCANRPDLWQRINNRLAEAASEPSFLESLLRNRSGIRPEATTGFLRTICKGQLLRIDSVNESVRRLFGIRWDWKSHKRDDLQPWLERWVEVLGDPDGRKAAFSSYDPGDFVLALWAEASTDVDSAINRIRDPGNLAEDLRIAAVHFLEICGPKAPAELVLDYVVDPDLRIANVAAGILGDWGNPMPSTAMTQARFENLCGYLKAVPAKPKLRDYPKPFQQRKLDLAGLEFAIARGFPDGMESVIESLLPKFNTDNRDTVIRRLNRYRQTEHDERIAMIMYGDDPEEWKQWLADNKGNQLHAQRILLLKMVTDRSIDVSEHAYKAVKNFTISHEEAAIIRPVLASKSARKRLFVTEMYAKQPDSFIESMVPGLLTSKRAGERLAALEMLRRLLENEERNPFAEKLWNNTEYTAGSDDEKRALEILKESLGADEDAEPPSLENAFGLIDPRLLPAGTEAREHDVMVHSPVTVRLIEALDAWIQERADVMIPSTRPWSSNEPERFGDANLPSPRRAKSREENLSQLPIVEELENWWSQRPAELRDEDGFELIRLKVYSKGLLGGSNRGRSLSETVYGVKQVIATSQKRLGIERLIDWLAYLHTTEMYPTGWRDYVLDATETLYARLSPKSKHMAHIWHQYFHNWFLTDEQCPDEILERIWSLARTPNPDGGVVFNYRIYEIPVFLKRGIATEDELIWFLAGPRSFDGYSRERAFNDLGSATNAVQGHASKYTIPQFQRPLLRLCERILELELGRGETGEVWSYAALAINRINGSEHLKSLLKALGDSPLVRKRPSGSKINVTRPAVLIHLISSSHPSPDDTPEEFARLMKEAGVSHDRLLEVALFRPVWTEFIEHATGIKGLRDAVGWIFAHTRTSDYQWEANARELWIGELGFQTPISADDLLAGAVDTDWFERASTTVGAKVWAKLYAAAKFASTGRGHTRVRLYADALQNKVKVPELKKILEGKGNLEAALAVGLPPLPKAEKSRKAELLRRYEILQELKLRSKKSKAQRRSSEVAAFEMGVRNLARRAGFTDTLRFEWAMETAAAADMQLGSLTIETDGIHVHLSIKPDGNLELVAERDGQALARIPAAAKKSAEFKALKQRMAELKQQAQRLRPALEDLMNRRVCLTSREWQGLLAHPLAGPLLARLILASEKDILGLPGRESLTGLNEKPVKWPPADRMLHIAHPVDFLPAKTWHAWQKEVFTRQLTQPFKQVFRELYLPAKSESGGEVMRFAGQQLLSHQVLGIMTKRGWSFHPEKGLHRIFRNEQITAWIHFQEFFHHFGEHSQITLDRISFTTGKPFKSLKLPDIPGRIFSEILRDADLIVSVAHATGADPEASESSIESRADLIRETCRLLNLGNVETNNQFARIKGALGAYRVHLGSAIVHREPGGMLPVSCDSQTERGRLFLPFADEDPRTAEVLSRVIAFARDEEIRDPALAKLLRNH